MERLRKTCGNCKYLDMFMVACDIDCEMETYYLDKEKTTFDCRPKFPLDCKRMRIEKGLKDAK